MTVWPFAGGKTKQTSVGGSWPKELFKCIICGYCGSKILECDAATISCIQYAPTLFVSDQPIVRSWPVDSKCEGARQSTSPSYFFFPHPASPRRSADQYKEDGRKHSQNFSVPDGAERASGAQKKNRPSLPSRRVFLLLWPAILLACLPTSRSRKHLHIKGKNRKYEKKMCFFALKNLS